MDSQLQQLLAQQQYEQQLRAQEHQAYAQRQAAALQGAAFPGVNGAVNNFVAGQMNGIYSGLGITPEVRGFVNQNVVQPVAAFGQQTVGLMGGLSSVYLSGNISGKAAEQQTALTNALARNTMNTGLTVGSVAGGIGLGIAGMAAPGVAAVAGIAGLAGAFLARPILQSGFWANVTGSKIFGMDDSVFEPLSFAKNQLNYVSGMQEMLQNESYRFISPSVKRGLYGAGLSVKSSQEWAKRIGTWDSKFQLEKEDISSILGNTIDNGLITNVKSIDEFESKFGKQVSYIKNASKILNKSVQEVSELMGEFKQAGISIDNFDMKAAELKSVSSLLGKSVTAVKDFMLSVSKTMSQGTMISASVMGDSALLNSGVMSFAMDSAKSSGNTGLVNLINNMGGATGAAGNMVGLQKQLFANANTAMPLAAFFNNVGGNLQFDQDRFRSMYSSVMSGGVSTSELVRQANISMQGWGSGNKMQWANDPNRYLSNLDPTVQMQMSSMLLKSIQSSNDQMAGLSNSQILTSVFRMDPSQAELFSAGLDSFNQYGPYLSIQGMVDPLRQVSIAARKNLLDARGAGGKWDSRELMEGLVNKLYITPANNLQNSMNDFLNKRVGISEEELMGGASNRTAQIYTAEAAARRRITSFLISYRAGMSLAGIDDNEYMPEPEIRMDAYYQKNFDKYATALDSIDAVLGAGGGLNYFDQSVTDPVTGKTINALQISGDALFAEALTSVNHADAAKYSALANADLKLVDDGATKQAIYTMSNSASSYSSSAIEESIKLLEAQGLNETNKRLIAILTNAKSGFDSIHANGNLVGDAKTVATLNRNLADASNILSTFGAGATTGKLSANIGGLQDIGNSYQSIVNNPNTLTNFATTQRTANLNNSKSYSNSLTAAAFDENVYSQMFMKASSGTLTRQDYATIRSNSKMPGQAGIIWGKLGTTSSAELLDYSYNPEGYRLSEFAALDTSKISTPLLSKSEIKALNKELIGLYNPDLSPEEDALYNKYNAVDGFAAAFEAGTAKGELFKLVGGDEGTFSALYNAAQGPASARMNRIAEIEEQIKTQALISAQDKDARIVANETVGTIIGSLMETDGTYLSALGMINNKEDIQKGLKKFGNYVASDNFDMLKANKMSMDFMDTMAGGAGGGQLVYKEVVGELVNKGSGIITQLDQSMRMAKTDAEYNELASAKDMMLAANNQLQKSDYSTSFSDIQSWQSAVDAISNVSADMMEEQRVDKAEKLPDQMNVYLEAMEKMYDDLATRIAKIEGKSSGLNINKVGLWGGK